MGHEFDPLSREVIAAAIEVHTALGPGFLESIYGNALHLALDCRNIAHERQKDVRVRFNGVQVGQHKLDLLVADQIVVELKAIKDLEDIHFAQVRSYLRATGKRIGLLMNFNKPTLVVKRVVN